MPLGVLITQCLQRDFCATLAPNEPVPCLLHVGHDEARRLLGDDPATGPVATFMRWAHDQPTDRLRVIHVRDWHDPQEPTQAAHLRRFGRHCVQRSRGADFVFETPRGPHSDARVVDSRGLSDFEGTSLPALLAEARAASPDGALRVGVVGVWTDAKVSFLLYDLRERAGVGALGTCSALTASASRLQHLNALDQLERLLEVRVEHAPSAFAAWLVGDEITLAQSRSVHPTPGALARLTFQGDPPARLASPEAPDRALVSWLFRECREVALTPLGGGFSGSSVLLAESEDALGHAQAPSVVKVGARSEIAAERANMERVEAVLGNNAPTVVDFADDAARAAIRFRYASMGGGRGRATSFQKLFQSGAPDEEVNRVLEAALGELLGRLYRAATPEPLDLLADYEFDPRWAPHVERHVATLAGDAQGTHLTVRPFGVTPNVARFYDTTLPALPRIPGARHPVAWVHGDLNGQNIVVDGGGNVWIIDFGRLRRAHALRDFAKLENDLLYIMTPLAEPQAHEAAVMVEALIDRDVSRPLGPPPPNVRHPALLRTWRALTTLRALAARVEGPHRGEAWRVAQLRYAAHTLSFDEPTFLQRRWALYAAGRLGRRVETDARAGDRLRVDCVEDDRGRIGMTLCPGRRDYGRDLERDLTALRESGYRHLFSILTRDELETLGVSEMAVAAVQSGLQHHLLPVPDGFAPDAPECVTAARTIARLASQGEGVVVHCRAGLGRTGTLVAMALMELGDPPDVAVARVRAARGARAIETEQQESFVKTYRPSRG